MLSTLGKQINESDITYIKFSIGGRADQSIKLLNKILSDNKIVIKPTDDNFLPKTNEKHEVEIKIPFGPKEFWGETTAVIKFAFNHICLPINILHSNFKRH